MSGVVPLIRCTSLETASIPGYLTMFTPFLVRDGQSGNYRALLYSGSNDSVIYDFDRECVVQSYPIHIGDASVQDMAMVAGKFLVGIGSGGTRCYDCIEQTDLSVNAPPEGCMTRKSALIPCPSGGLYVIGGERTELVRSRTSQRVVPSPTRSVEFLNLTRRHEQWRQKPRLLQKRTDAAGVFVDQQLVLVGGSSGTGELLQSTEIFNGLTWLPGVDLNIPRSNPSVLVVEGNVVVIGGRNDAHGGVVSAVEAWDLQTDRFQVIGRLPLEPGRDITALAVENTVYIFQTYCREIQKMTLQFDQFSSVSVPGTLQPSASPSELDHRRHGDSEANIPYPQSTIGGFPDPAPPSRPERGSHVDLIADGPQALQSYIDTLQYLEQVYDKSIEEAIQRRIEKCNQEIDHMQKQASIWKEENQRLIDRAKDTMDQQRTFSENQHSFICRTLIKSDQDDFGDEVPSQLRCPISLALMVDPVVAADGIVYERSSLEAWFTRCKGKDLVSPMTGAKLEHDCVFPVQTLKTLCQQFSNREGKRLSL